MSASLICEIHKKKLDTFCKTHDEVLCASCIQINHKTCNDIISLEKAAKNAKTSTALNDVNEIIADATENIEHWIIDRESVSENLYEQEKEIKRHIHKTRNDINKRLDDLQQNILQELATKHSDCQFRNGKIIKYLKAAENDLKKIKEDILHLKESTSDVDVFLGTLKVNKNVVEKNNEVKAELKYVTGYSIEAEIDPKIKSLMNTVHQFGQISIHETVANLSFKEAKINQAQIHLPKIHTVSDIKLQLKQKFKIKKDGEKRLVSSCSLLPNTNVLIADYRGKEQLMEYSNKGEHIRDISIPGKPFDLTLVDENHVAVSYGFGSMSVDIINISNNIVEKKIKIKRGCHGVSYQDGKIYVVADELGIVVVDTEGRTMNTIKCDVRYVLYLTTTKDRIYYTNSAKHKIHCCTNTGKEIWVFQDDSLKYPSGISVDNNQNVFVVGRHSNNLTVIQHDGEVFTTLLTKSDGLNFPDVVCFNKDKKILFVVNSVNGKAAFYQAT